jgi:hypothetical protein
MMCFPSLFEALAEAVTRLDVRYTAAFGFVVAVAVLLKQALLAAPPETRATSR